MTTIDKPTVLTPQVQRQIIASLRDGAYVGLACRLAGISVRTYYYWRRLVADGAAHAQRFAPFYAGCDRVSANAEAEAVDRLRLGRPDWRAAAWWLERRFPQRWRKRPRERRRRTGFR
jgi:hypothetical protein